MLFGYTSLYNSLSIFYASNSSHDSSDTLLPINEDLLADSRLAVLKLDIRVIIPGLRPTPAAVQRNPDALQPILYDPHFSPC